MVASLTGVLLAAGVLVTVSGGAGAAAAPPAPSPAAVRVARSDGSETAAIAEARQTGVTVTVADETTPTGSVTANPNGTLTLTQHPVPVRKKVNGVWTPLDATLRANPDGSVSPAVTMTGLSLSGGGTGPAATMRSGSRSLSLTLPMALPAPVLAGATATYRGVLPDVDLRLTANTQGGFQQVLVVHTAAAAASPRLAALTLATRATGVTVTADADGNLRAADARGEPVFVAGAPQMWDSTRRTGSAPTLTDPRTGRALDAASGDPVESTVDGPGTGARRAPIGVRLAAGGITLIPAASLLTSAATVYPVYIDPTWTPVQPVSGGAHGGYASVSDQSTGNKWNNTFDPVADNMQVGDEGTIRSRTLINFGIDTGTLHDASISKALLKITNVYSFSCTPSKTRVFAPATSLTQANATWAAWFGSSPIALGNEISNYPAFAFGHSGSCPQNGVSFDVMSAVIADAQSGKSAQTFVLTGDTNEGTDVNSWKKFSIASATMEIDYDHAPPVPTGLHTSPQTPCTGTVGAVGDGQVALYAPLYDQDGGPLGVTYNVWQTSVPGTLIKTTDPNTFSGTSGTDSVLILDESLLKPLAGNTVTEFSWKVQVWDGFATSPWSATCNFNFDPTRAGAPFCPPPPNPVDLRTQLTINCTKPAGTTPTSYLYQVNAGPPVSKPADANGGVAITITPTVQTSVLTVTSVSAAGNIGQTTAVPISTRPDTSSATPDDLTGDGVADLLAVGGAHNLPSGLWLSAARNSGLTGQITTTATNLGLNGNGVAGDNQPADFDRAQAITGNFTASGPQDIFIYYPTGIDAAHNGLGSGAILNTNGDGSPLQPQLSGNEHTILSNELLEHDDNDNPVPGTAPQQITNAGDAIANGDPIDDLIAIAGPTTSRHLDYYFYASTHNLQGVLPISAPTPAGDQNWSAWNIAATHTSTGQAMFVWNPTTGDLYLWKNLDMSSGDLTYTQILIRTAWHTGTDTLRAADINHDGTPDLWTVATNQTVTAYLVTGLATTPTITAQPSQTLATATHNWNLNDKPTTANAGDPVTTTTDNTPSNPLTATGNTHATWNTGDLFNPDISFSTNSSLSTNAAVNTNADFSVSVWAKLVTTGGVVLSQDGVNTAGFKLSTDSSDNSWRFDMSRSDAAGAIWDTASSGPGTAPLGAWTHITATYKQSSGIMNLYVNGANVSSAYHTTTWNATGNFQFGDYLAAAGTRTGFLNGQLAAAQTWNQVIEPAQALASYYQPIQSVRLLDTRIANGVTTTTPVPGGTSISVQVTGVNGIPATGVTAVALSVAAVAPPAFGYLIVTPAGAPRPNVSNLNFAAGQTLANLVVANVGTNGRIDIFAGATTHIVADAVGYYTTDATLPGDTTYTPLNPTRFFDTRTGQGVPQARLLGGSTLSVQIGGTGGVPNGVTAVVINLATIGSTAAGSLEPYADGTTRTSVASGLQYGASGTVVAGLAIVPVGANGKIDIWSSAGSLDLIGDVEGYYTPGTTAQKYHPIAPIRLNDTRIGTGGVTGPLPTGTVLKVKQSTVTTDNAATLMLNVTVANETVPGFIIAYPDGIATPGTSTINYSDPNGTANALAGATGGGLTDLFVNQASGTAQLIVDCSGYFSTN